MARQVMKMPDIGEGVVDVEIVAWHVKPGDTVAEDQHFVDVMTDKATVEMSSPVAGVVSELCAEPGARITVGAQLIVFETDAALAAAPAAAANAVAAREPEPEAAPAAAPAPPEPPSPVRAIPPEAAMAPAAPSRESIPIAHDSAHRAAAAPTVRRRAREALIDLAGVPASGKGGRITHEDLDRYISGARPTPKPAVPLLRDTGDAAQYHAHPVSSTAIPVPGAPGMRTLKLIGLRRVIAEKMALSKRRIPHYSYVEEVDLSELESLRQHMNAARRADQPKLTYLAFIVRALVKALREFPQCNAHFDDEAGVVTQFDAVHAGIAAQTPNGLMVPVVHDAQALDLWQTAAEIQRASDAARNGKASRAELSGSTITITSLGKLGGLASTPVINHPQVAILGINKSELRPVVRDGAIVARLMMNLSASFDHRIVDGHDGASLVQAIKGLLEHPATIFV
ncbi:MAG: 2-oxo acid dehydrogenase subunit E2 [Gammaproteobacteria bacterium]|nr:2-oxo acid dehydrogenase subunit E2 [Gammaproteobacteria bacterium]